MKKFLYLFLFVLLFSCVEEKKVFICDIKDVLKDVNKKNDMPQKNEVVDAKLENEIEKEVHFNDTEKSDDFDDIKISGDQVQSDLQTEPLCEIKQLKEVPFGFIKNKNGFLYDENGRVVFLRGINFSGMENGKTEVFNKKHFEIIKSFGFNMIRLALGWKGMEPEEGKINEDYLKDIDRIVELASSYGIYVLLDMHQWYWEYAGMPEWSCSAEKEKSNDYIFACSTQFFNSSELISKFIENWMILVSKYKDNPYVLGYDLLNEPPPVSTESVLDGSFEKEILMPFYEKLISKIREVDENHLIIIEPNIACIGPNSLQPFEDENIAYSPHIYVPHTYNEEGLIWIIKPSVSFLKNQFSWAYKTGKKLKAHVLIGEYGIKDDVEFGGSWLDTHILLQNEYKFSSAYWDLKGGWGIIDKQDEIKPFYKEHLLLPYVQAISTSDFTFEAHKWNGFFDLKFKTTEKDFCNITEISMPAMLYTTKPEITVKNAKFEYDKEKGKLFILPECANCEVVVRVR